MCVLHVKAAFIVFYFLLFSLGHEFEHFSNAYGVHTMEVILQIPKYMIKETTFFKEIQCLTLNSTTGQESLI